VTQTKTLVVWGGTINHKKRSNATGSRDVLYPDSLESVPELRSSYVLAFEREAKDMFIYRES
jgi:hypothetical protein